MGLSARSCVVKLAATPRRVFPGAESHLPAYTSESAMSRHLKSLVWVSLLLIVCSALAQAPAPSSADWVPGRLLAEPSGPMTNDEWAAHLRPHGGGRLQRIGATDIHIIELPPEASEVAARVVMERSGRFKYVELDRKVQPAFVANDPYLSRQWHTAKIGTPAAWDGAKGAGITIAIIDTGTDGAHPDLAANMVPGWNFFNGTANATSPNGHGTWTAGSAAAVMNNALGVAGVAGAAKIMPLRVTDDTGTGYWSMITSAISYAADHGARVANASFDSLLLSSSILSASNYMRSKGGLVVIAAGNSGTDLGQTPSTAVITVSATDANDVITTWSSFGPCVSISAPGNYIWTTAVGTGYTQGIGTSFSAPVVAGVVALMMSARPDLPPAKVESLLYATALDLGASGRDPYYGYGRVDASRAVAAAIAEPATPAPPTDVTAPLAAFSSPQEGSVVYAPNTQVVATADDANATTIQLFIDGVLRATGPGPKLSYNWNAKKATYGAHLLTVKARDSAGNIGSASINVRR